MIDWTRQPDPDKDADFFRALDEVEKSEGGYADDPDDRGGATKWGVTQSVYDQFRNFIGQGTQPVVQMSDEECTDIYYCAYWLDAGCDRLTWPFAFCHFDAVVNMAPYWWRQCKAAAAGNCNAYCDKRVWCYNEIVKRNEKLGKFLPGWLIRVARVRKVCS